MYCKSPSRSLRVCYCLRFYLRLIMPYKRDCRSCHKQVTDDHTLRKRLLMIMQHIIDYHVSLIGNYQYNMQKGNTSMVSVTQLNLEMVLCCSVFARNERECRSGFLLPQPDPGTARAGDKSLRIGHPLYLRNLPL